MRPEVTHALMNRRPQLRSHLRRSFPRFSDEDLDDAASEALLDAVRRPALFEQAWERGGERGLYRLYRCVAWRKLRGQWRRKERRVAGPALAPQDLRLGRAAGQELSAALDVNISRAMDEAVCRFGGLHPERLRAALVERFLSGDPDIEIARRHGVSRESLNKAKRFIQDRVIWS